ncbi:MAG TPA: hypothetical protein VL069_09210 [Opitutus sp.]|nr:hypothetical protein [Opitutus sp.]
MNFRHALGFFAVGAVLALIPRIAPGWCPADGVDGTSTRTIWLQIMSFVQMGLGVAYFANRTLVGLMSLFEYTPPTARTGYSTATVRPALSNPAFRSVLPVPALSPIRVAIRDGLIDQRRAA